MLNCKICYCDVTGFLFNIGNDVIPVAASVIAVHIVIGIYVWMAIKEGDDIDSEPLKED